MNYYVYAHVNKSNGQTFYIGKGCGNRAWSADGRTTRWLNIATEHGRSVHILAKNLTEQAALELERQLIDVANKQGLVLVNVHGSGSGGLREAAMRKRRAKNFGLDIDGIIEIKQRKQSVELLSEKFKLTTAQIRCIQNAPSAKIASPRTRRR